MSAEQLEKTITAYGLTANKDAINVTVTGTLNRSDDKILTLDIPDGIKVKWQASLTGNVYDELIVKKGKGELEILGGYIGNSKVNSLYNAIRVDEGNLTIFDGTISAEVGYGVKNNSAGTIKITGGKILIRGGSSSGIHNVSIGSVEISGGTIKAYYAVNNASSGTVNIKGGILSAAASAVLNSSTGTVNISGGTMTSSGGSKMTICGLSSNGTINISGGEISANYDDDGTADGTVVSSVGKINIFSPAKITSK